HLLEHVELSRDVLEAERRAAQETLRSAEIAAFEQPRRLLDLVPGELEPELRGLVHGREEQLVSMSGLRRVRLQREQLVRTQVPLVVARSGPWEDWFEIFGVLHRHKKGAHEGNMVSPMTRSILSAVSDLFSDAASARLMDVAPLAMRLRPTTLEEFVGQEQILGDGSALRLAIAEDRVGSMILYGPPGSGKTTLARIVAHTTGAFFEELSAVSATVKQVREVIAAARERLGATGQRTILFLDEIHRFNKAQQDALLPAVEEGLLTLIGATTENPYFEV